MAQAGFSRFSFIHCLLGHPMKFSKVKIFNGFAKFSSVFSVSISHAVLALPVCISTAAWSAYLSRSQQRSASAKTSRSQEMQPNGRAEETVS
jgi:hypothetical protein